MFSFKYIQFLLYMSSITLGGLAAATPLCSNITGIVGGGPPNIKIPSLISLEAIKGFQLALFLENLESSFFNTGLMLIKNQGTSGYSNGTIEIVSKVTAMSTLFS